MYLRDGLVLREFKIFGTIPYFNLMICDKKISNETIFCTKYWLISKNSLKVQQVCASFHLFLELQEYVDGSNLCILCPFQVKMMLWFLCLSFFHWDDCFFFLMQPCCGWFDSQWSFIKADLIYILRALTYMFLYKMPWRSLHWLNKLVKAHFPVLDSLVEDWDSLHGMWFAASKVLYWP